MKTFLYLHCGDLELARHFYSDLLGLLETYFSAEEGTIGYQVGTLQFAVSTHGDADYVDGWSQQLGWQGGSTATPSWGFEFPAAEFARVVESIRGTEIDTLHPEPRWIGYWSFPVKDPMGYTVEITTPNRTAWPTQP